jgi:hypothetical protein
MFQGVLFLLPLEKCKTSQCKPMPNSVLPLLKRERPRWYCRKHHLRHHPRVALLEPTEGFLLKEKSTVQANLSLRVEPGEEKLRQPPP